MVVTIVCRDTIDCKDTIVLCNGAQVHMRLWTMLYGKA